VGVFAPFFIGEKNVLKGLIMNEIKHSNKSTISGNNIWYRLKNIFGVKKQDTSKNILPENWAKCYSIFSSLGEAVMLNKIVYDKWRRPIDYIILDVNHPSFETLTGIKREGAIGILASKVYGDNRAPFLAEISQCIDTKKTHTIETFFPAIKKHVTLSIFYLEDGQFVTVLSDISERKTKENELSRSQYLLESIISQSPDIIYRLDTNGKITFISEAIRTYGYSPEELIGCSLLDIVHPEDKDNAKYKVNERRTGERSTKTHELRILALTENAIPFETVLIDVQKEPSFVLDAEGQYVQLDSDQAEFAGTQGIMRDITSRKMAHKILERANEELDELVNMRTGQLEKALDKLIHENAIKQQTEEKLHSAQIKLKKLVEERTEELATVTKTLKKERSSHESLGWELKKYTNIVEQMGDSVIITDKEGHIEYVNKAFLDFNGYTIEEVLGKKPSILKSGMHKDPFYSSLWKKISHGEIFRGTVINKKKNGEIYYKQETISPLKNIDGIITHYVSTGKDITKHVESEKTLRASENSYKALFDNNPSVMFRLNSKGEIVSVNNCGATKLGYSVDELLGRSLNELYHKDDQKKQNDGFKECLKSNKQIVNSEFRIIHQSGITIWGDETMQAISIGECEPDILVVRNDITGRKKAETEKEELQSQLLQIQKMDAIGTLAGGIAHDFNNMLTVINGHAEVALLNLNKDQPGHRHMISILKAGKRAENLTRQLLAFSRKQIFDPQILNMNNIISDLEKMMRRLIGEDFSIKMELKDNLPTIKGEPGQIEQILINLIVNARDAINAHTDIASEKKITIETDTVVMDDAYVSQHAGSKTGNYVVIAVSDNGIGMNEKVQRKIFEPFFTTKEVGQGTGLGLSTVYGIVKQNDSFIYVYSEVNRGTTFKIYWPISDLKESSSDVENNVIHVSEAHETVLLVEDDESVRDFAASALLELGYHVYEASNGKNALDLVKEKDLRPHLVITDMIMPEMNGKELVSNLEVIMPNIKVIYTSGYTDNYIVQQGELIEGINFIQKPFSLEKFTRKIRDVLANNNILV
jgi:PAS domain S-box-containing protein